MIRRWHKLRALCAWSAISAWVLFLAASAPHRVHHLLEHVAPLSRDASTSVTPAKAAEEPAPERATRPQTICRRHTHHNNHSHEHCETTADSAATAAPVSTTADTAVAQRHDHGGHDHANAPKQDAQHDTSTQTGCVLQAAAQNSPAIAKPIHGIPNVKANPTGAPTLPAVRAASYNLAPFSQRAPPPLCF